MRILFVNHKCGYFGGVEQNVAVTAAGLDSLGHECYLAYGEETDRDPEGYQSIFQTAVRCQETGADWDACSSHAFRDIVQGLRPDVIYVHKVPSIACYVELLDRVRIVRMVHDHDLCCPRRHKFYFHSSRICHHKAGWRCYLDLGFLARSNGGTAPFTLVSISKRIREMRRNYKLHSLLVGSRFMRDELLQNGFEAGKIHILPPVTPMGSPHCAPAPEEPVILCVAQLIKGKGVDLLLRALSKISGRFSAIIVGSGNAEPALKGLAKTLGLEDKVRFQGWVRPEDIDEFYSMAKVVVVPSRWAEPFGMVGLEAMNHGRPVVAFNVGGIPDWLEHDVTGFLVPEQDIDQLAISLERILEDTQLARRLGANGKKRVRERFSFENYLQRMVRYLEGSLDS